MSPKSSLALSGVAAILCSLAVPNPAHAQEPVPGEKWRQSATMEMNGMKMPGQTSEICVPIKQRDEALSSPPENCEMYDMKRSGNRFSAKMRCTGENAGEGSIETISEGPDKSRTTIKMTREGGMTMMMSSEMTKLPGSCDAAEIERRIRKAEKEGLAAAAAAKAKACRDPLERMKKDPYQTAINLTTYYPFDGGGGDATVCDDPKSKAEACKYVGTRAGFWSLDYDERMRKKQAASAVTPAQKKQLLRYTHAYYTRDCGFGDIAVLKKRLVEEAEAAGDWGFLIHFSPAQADAIGKQECSGRGFTDAKNPQYKAFCARWGLKFAAEGAQATDLSAPPSAAGSATAGTDAAASDATNADGETAPVSAKDKAKDAAQKAKKALRNIFGGS